MCQSVQKCLSDASARFLTEMSVRVPEAEIMIVYCVTDLESWLMRTLMLIRSQSGRERQRYLPLSDIFW